MSGKRMAGICYLAVGPSTFLCHNPSNSNLDAGNRSKRYLCNSKICLGTSWKQWKHQTDFGDLAFDIFDIFGTLGTLGTFGAFGAFGAFGKDSSGQWHHIIAWLGSSEVSCPVTSKCSGNESQERTKLMTTPAVNRSTARKFLKWQGFFIALLLLCCITQS